MNVRVQDDDSSDSERRSIHHVERQPSNPPQVYIYRAGRTANHQDDENSRFQYVRSRSKGPKKEELHEVTLPRRSRRRRGRRSPVIEYVEGSQPVPPSTLDVDQDSDDVLDDYYSGVPCPPPDGKLGRLDDNYDPLRYDRLHYSKINEPAYPSNLAEAALGSRPDVSRPSYVVPPNNRHDSRPVRRTDDSTITIPPHGARGMWSRAAATPPKSSYKLSLTLKLVLTRRGERYKGRPFRYSPGSWDDSQFARRLKHEYRSLKVSEIGFMQKITSYKTISFVYFLQYHAFRDGRFRFGRWEITDRLPITPKDDDKARSSFMYQLDKKARRESTMFDPAGGKPHTKRPTRDWVSRMDSLVEAGAVIDIEVKETFDAMKIYLGLLLAILLSLATGLAYGFARDNDFSTGFSIASWLLTAFGFFAAVVAAGEYLGLDSPAATLSAADELEIGRKLPAHLEDP